MQNGKKLKQKLAEVYKRYGFETSDWGMRRIFDDLAYRHYKKKNWAAMLHSKVRMRVSPTLSDKLVSLMNSHEELAKAIFRINRKNVIHCFAYCTPKLPITLDNIVYVWNHIGPKNPLISDTTPTIVIDAIQEVSKVEAHGRC